jgi:hypothetical protein
MQAAHGELAALKAALGGAERSREAVQRTVASGQHERMLMQARPLGHLIILHYHPACHRAADAGARIIFHCTPALATPLLPPQAKVEEAHRSREGLASLLASERAKVEQLEAWRRR